MGGVSPASSLLRARRIALRLSQEELAERSERSVRTIRNLESGSARRPHPDTLRAVALALELDAIESADFVSSWRYVAPDQFLAAKAHEDAIAQTFFEMRRRVRDIAVHHVVSVDASGRQNRYHTRRSFEAVSPGVREFPWMTGLPDLPDFGRIRVTDCVNMRLASTTMLPVTGAIGFVGDLGAELAVGEIRSIEYRTTLEPTGASRPPGDHDREAFFASGTSLDFVCVEARFDPDLLPARVWSVRRSNVHDHDPSEDVEVEVALSSFGIAQYVVRASVGFVYGLRWDWPDESG